MTFYEKLKAKIRKRMNLHDEHQHQLALLLDADNPYIWLFRVSWWGYYGGLAFSLTGLAFNNLYVGMFGAFEFGLCLTVLGMRHIVLGTYKKV
jgi:hypothetical protein